MPPVPTPSPDNVAEAAKANRSFSAKQRTAKKRIAIAADALSTAARVDVPDMPKDDATTELIGALQRGCNLAVSARIAATPERSVILSELHALVTLACSSKADTRPSTIGGMACTSYYRLF